jgi:hypothetical protein
MRVCSVTDLVFFSWILIFLTSSGINFEPIDIEFNFLIPKVVPKLSEIWVGVRDPVSGKIIPGPDQGVKKAPDPGSESATLRVCGSEKTNLNFVCCCLK